MNKLLKNRWAYLLFLLPSTFLYTVFMIVPIVQSLYLSFFRWDRITEKKFIGLANYSRLVKDQVFWNSFMNNMYFILFAVLISIPLILVIAILISRVKKLRSFYKTGVFLPVVLSTAIVGILWQFIYRYDVGLLNNFLHLFNEDWVRAWLGDPSWAMISVLIANGWQWHGFYIVLVLAAILSIPKELNEAAEIDGASGFQQVFYITLPLIRPMLILVFILSIAGSMRALDIVIVMTGGGPFRSTEVMATYMYERGFQQWNWGYASAIASAIFFFTLAFVGSFQFFTKEKKEVEY